MKSTHIPKKFIDETLAAKPVQGKRALEPFKQYAAENALPIIILEDHQVSNEAEIHRHEADLWICLEGEVAFVVGGQAIRPEIRKSSDGTEIIYELRADGIEGGDTYTLRSGDILHIPAGEPHLHKTDDTARLFVIKISTRDIIPLERVPGWMP